MYCPSLHFIIIWLQFMNVDTGNIPKISLYEMKHWDYIWSEYYLSIQKESFAVKQPSLQNATYSNNYLRKKIFKTIFLTKKVVHRNQRFKNHYTCSFNFRLYILYPNHCLNCQRIRLINVSLPYVHVSDMKCL